MSGDSPESTARAMFSRLSRPEYGFVVRALRQETVGGLLLLGAAVVAVVWVNSGWADSYYYLESMKLGPSWLSLDVEHWTADGLLAVFFFIAGLELKRELVVGSLRDPARAVLPVVAAIAGMVVPALLYVLVSAHDPSAVIGWGIPMATDIAFALAVLAVIGSHLPRSLRAFLLTLAVVDDLGAILVIALFYTDRVSLLWLLVSVVLLACYALAQRARVRSPLLYVPLASAVWLSVHQSGVHATIAGVALGLLTRVRPDAGEHESPAERLEHRIRPLSAGVCVPLFALFSAGVPLSASALAAVAADPVGQAVFVGLVLGKALGVFGAAYLAARFTRATLDPGLTWGDVAGVSLLAGVGFTVSLLISELAFASGSAYVDAAKTSVLAASLTAAVLAGVVLGRRNRAYRASEAAESHS